MSAVNLPSLAGAEKNIKRVKTILWLALAGGAGLLIADKVLPLIARVLKMGINVGLLLIPAAILLIILTSPRFWNFLNFVINSLGRFFVGLYQSVDPIGILETSISIVKAKYRNIEEQLTVFRGVIADITETIEENKRQHERDLRLAGQAHKQADVYAFRLQARRAGRLVESNMTYQLMLEKLQLVYRILVRIKEVSNFIIEDSQDQVTQLKKRKRAMDAATSAIQSAWSIIKGGVAKDFADETAARLVEKLNQQAGEIVGFVDIAQDFISSFDLQQGIFDEAALQKLQAWETQVDSALLGDEKAGLLLTPGMSAIDDPMAALGRATGGRYADLVLAKPKMTASPDKTFDTDRPDSGQ